MRPSVFFKVSGDVCTSDGFLAQVAKLARAYFVVICVGGGKQINEAFSEAGLPVKKHGPLGRESETLGERQLARDVLEMNKVALENLLAARRIPATVVIPVLDIGSVLCHVNGDVFLEAAYLGFDVLCVVTTPDRKKKKQTEFAHLPKIRVIAIKPD